MARGKTQRATQRPPKKKALPDESVPAGAELLMAAARPAARPKDEDDEARTMAERAQAAWHGWVKPVGGLVVVMLGYLAYQNGFLPEQAGGRVLVPLILGGAMYLALAPVWRRVEAVRTRRLLIALAVAWALAAIGPMAATLFPGKVLAQATLTGASDAGTTPAVEVDAGKAGPFELRVFGKLAGRGEAEAHYTVHVVGDHGQSDVDGKLERTLTAPASGSVPVAHERLEALHRADGAQGPKLKLSADLGGGALMDGLHVEVRKAPPQPVWFFALGALVLLVGGYIDYRLHSPTEKRTYVSVAAGFTLVFAAYYPTEATPHSLVRPAVATLLFALLVGALGAWLLSFVALGSKPRPKKLAGVKNRYVEG